MTPELFEYSQLTTHQQAVARASVIAVECAALQTSMKMAKHDFRRDLHAVINNAHHIPRLLYSLTVIKRLRTDPAHLEAVIESNLCRFSRDGAMYLFMTKTFVSAEPLQPTVPQHPEEK